MSAVLSFDIHMNANLGPSPKIARSTKNEKLE